MGIEKERFANSARSALTVVEGLHDLRTATASELAATLDLPIDTVRDHLSTLAAEGYVVDDDGEYRIGFRFLEHGGRVRSDAAIYRHGRPEVDKLAKDTGELANLMVEEHGQGVHIYLAKGVDALAFDTYAGKRFNLHNNALGKSILSQLPRERVDDIVDTHGLAETTENTVSDRDALYEELTTVRERGYAVDDEERLDGLRCVAAPVTVEGDVVGSVSVSGPATRIKGDRFHETLPEMVVRTADHVGLNISYS